MIKLPACTYLLLLLLTLDSCIKKELPVPVHQSGDVTGATASMDPTYKYQVYFSLKNNAEVGRNLKTIWDIGFETGANGYHVVLNTSKSMFARNTGKTAFTSVSYNDTAGFAANKKWDACNGEMDSTAIGDWRSDTNIYIIDRGFNELGQQQGMEKLQLLSVSSDSYTLRFAALDGTGDTTVTITKDTTYNLAFLSFSTRMQLLVEPPKNSWDIAFTQYTYVFYDEVPPVPYLVTGCLLNRYNTMAVRDTNTGFKDIVFADLGRYSFAYDLSAIGYDWKTYNGSGYTINTGYNYIIHASEGVYYKLHFIGFYNNSGLKGNPAWEYQQL